MRSKPADASVQDAKDKVLTSTHWIQHFLSGSFGTSVAAVLLALLVGAVLISFLGVDPIKAYVALLDGAFGNKNSIAETFVKAIPLALTGVGISIAFRASAFNVGAEGQLYIGAIAATGVGLLFPESPRIIVIPLMILTAVLGGAIWAFIPAYLKTKLNASELINTIMLNYIAIFLVNYLVHGPIQEPGSPLGQTAKLAEQARLIRFLPGTRLHSGAIIAILVTFVAYVLLWHTPWGYKIRVAGKNPKAAHNAGISVNWAIVSSLMVSGAIAGIAGFSEASGVHLRMIENISPGYGYTGIVVALLGQTNPPFVLLAAVLFAALEVGATTMETAVGVPSSIASIVQYLIVLLIMGRGAFALLRERNPFRHQIGK